MQPPTLSLCMIVKNEEQNLPVLLDSIKSIVDEIIIIDTGSTDRTIEVAKQYGAIIKEIPWENHFAKARNKSLQYATCDWIIWADADDYFPPASVVRIKELKDQPPANQAFGFMIKCAERGSFGTVHNHIRLFPNHRQIEFKYRVHEQIADSLARAKLIPVYTNIIIQHIGYQNKEALTAKQTRNQKLLATELLENPNDCLITFSLAGAENDLGNPQKAVELYHQTITIAQNTPGRVMLVQAALVRLIQLCWQKDLEKADEYIAKLLNENPSSPQGLSFKALRLQDKQETARAKEIFLRLVDLKEEQTAIPIDYNQIKLHASIKLSEIARDAQDLEGMRKYLLLAMEIQEGGRLPCFKKGDLFLKCGRVAEANAAYLQGIEQKEPESFMRIASLLIKQHKLPEAELLLQKAFATCPDSQLLKDFVAQLAACRT